MITAVTVSCLDHCRYKERRCRQLAGHQNIVDSEILLECNFTINNEDKKADEAQKSLSTE